jgi:NADH-quinone oxidoreductase subunit J
VELRQGFLQYLPVGALVGLVLLVELVLVLGAWVAAPEAAAVAQQPIPPVDQVTNTEAIGRVLYTDYIYLFQACGMILLVAMIGAIVLTLRQREGVRRQSIGKQVGRKVGDTIEVKKVPSRSGV